MRCFTTPVEAFVLHLDRAAEEQVAETRRPIAVQPHQTTASSRFRPAAILAFTILLICAGTGSGWWFLHDSAVVRKAPDGQPTAQAGQPSQPAATQAATPPDIGLTNAPHLSVVVLP